MKKSKHQKREKQAQPALPKHPGLCREPDIPIFLIGALIVLVVLYIFSFWQGHGAVGVNEPYLQRECEEGTTKQCMIDNCTGLAICRSGKWEGCRLELVCTPGSIMPCIEDYCVIGYKRCNECGTGYENCTKRT